MAQKIDFRIPFNDLTNYVPRELRNPVINGLIDNLFNRHMTHDESAPLYGYIGQKPSSTDTSPRIPQSTSDRDLNAIVPILNFVQGSDRVAYTTTDIIAKARAIGITEPGLRWLYSQANNYVPPINIDKFTNYYNYFWVAPGLTKKPSLSWNPDLLPEYYVIASPNSEDADKLNVDVATTGQVIRTGSGFNSMYFTMTFTSATAFTIAAVGTLPAGYTVSSTPSSLAWAYNGTVETKTITITVTNGTTSVVLLTYDVVLEPSYDSFGNVIYTQSISSGDKYTITPIFLSKNYTLTFSGSSGLKYKITNIVPLNTYQTINGVQLSAGMRVLVKNNTPSENGIYVVGPQSWARADDYDGQNIQGGARVWDKTTKHLFVSTTTNAWVDAGLTTSNTNAWQESNYWVHRDDLVNLDVDQSVIVQGTRPIIEFESGVQLNSYYNADGPSDAGTLYEQIKSEFNQIPLFDLYRYDGTHSGYVSSLFYYVEDSEADLDTTLQRRVKLSSNESKDYLFNHGMMAPDGHLLFYKKADGLHTIWKPGYSSVTVAGQSFKGKAKGVVDHVVPTTSGIAQTWTLTATSSTTFSVVGSVSGLQIIPITVGIEYSGVHFSAMITDGEINFAVGDTFTFSISSSLSLSTVVFNGITKGSLTNIVPAPLTQQQVWTLTATSSTTFAVSGSKNKTLPSAVETLTVNQPYSNANFSCLITAGTLPFDEGDTFTFRIGNVEMPRYVYRDSDDLIYDLYGGESADTNSIGAYTPPRSFYNNPYNESRGEVPEGTLYSHFRGILQNQLTDDIDYGFGGSIKGWSEQHTLLASLLMQQEMTPISLIDYAQRMYETSLNTLEDLFRSNIVQYFASYGVVDYDGTAEQDARIEALLDYLLTIRASDNDVKTVLFDSTSSVIGFPITLPQLGVVDLVSPGFVYDRELGQTILQHHDGHYSALTEDDVEFRQSILNNKADITVLHADGTSSAAVGSFNVEPASPYRGQLWFRPVDTGSVIYAFDVESDADEPTSPSTGTLWYDRQNGNLLQWSGSAWDTVQTSVAWRQVNIADTLNRLLLAVETRLFNGINPNIRKIDTASLGTNTDFQAQMTVEFYRFCSFNGYNPTGTDYDSTNALTWNYSSALTSNFPALNTSSVPARWFNILKAHQATVSGVIPTERPDVEPWKLLGFNTKSAWWSTLNSTQQTAFTAAATPDQLDLYGYDFVRYVRLVKTTGGTVRAGLQIIDGVQTATNDLVLLVNEGSAVENGLWQVSPGSWTRISWTGAVNSYFTTTDGYAYKGTTWILTQAVGTFGVDAVHLGQVRLWSNAMWAYIQSQRPTLRLSVDTIRDVVLPPYVSPSTSQAVNALTTVIPSGTSLQFLVGQSGPVESVWYKTMDYQYSIARALFRYDPLMFLGFCWGFNWVEVDGILYDGFDLNFPGHKRFRLHGEPVTSTHTVSDLKLFTVSNTAAYEISMTYDGYDSNRKQNFSVRQNGSIIAHVQEGVVTSFSGFGFAASSVLIEDFGVPFHIGDKFTVVYDGSTLTKTFVPASTYNYLGFGQVFSNALRSMTIDTNASYSIDAFRNWDVNMGYRVGGLVTTDSLAVTSGDLTLSTASYELVIKKNPIAKDIWVQALRISPSTIGSSKAIDIAQNDVVNTAYIPTADASDWIFTIEGYNPRHNSITYYELDTNGSYYTFNVLNQASTTTVWKQYRDVTNTVTAQLPLTIVGAQNVVNFLFGYVRYLDDINWGFNLDPSGTTDAETGRARGWQLDVEKFLNTCYTGVTTESAYVANPFFDTLWVKQPTGLLGQFQDTALFDISTHAGVFDVLGVKFKASDLFIIRGNEQSQISASAPMFSAHAQIDEYEHLFIFENYVESSTLAGLLYDPFSGARMATYKFDGRRQATDTFRPEYGGHYLVGNRVRQNIQASTDAVAKFYDANTVFDNERTSRHAMALLGFSEKSYFEDLNVSKKTQFNFWRGLVQSKGTNRSIDAFMNNSHFEDAQLDEYWAYKVAEYGDARVRSFPELKIETADTPQRFTLLQFDSVGTEFDGFTQIANYDESRWFSIDDLNQEMFFRADMVGKYTVTNTSASPLTVKLPFVADQLVCSTAFTRLNSTTVIVPSGTSIFTGYGFGSNEHSPMKLFDYVSNDLVQEIPVWHPAAGLHTPTAVQNINVISTKNPAKYNRSTLVKNNNSYDPLRPWGSKEVGRIWFDTTNLEYIPYYDTTVFTSREDRLLRWGALADFSSLDVYEWVQSTVAPSEYNALAAEQAGDADLNSSTKAAGEVALGQTYYRDRLWYIRPIAWSKAGRPFANAHPTFASSFNQRLFFDAGTAYLESGTFADYDVTSGMRIGAWDNTTLQPLNEYSVTTNWTKKFVHFAPSVLSTSDFTVSYALDEYNSFNGQMSVFSVIDSSVRQTADDGSYIDQWNTDLSIRVTTSSGEDEVILINTAIGTNPTSPTLYGATITLVAGQTQTFSTSFGLGISITPLTSGTFTANVLRDAIVSALDDYVTIYDAVEVSEVVGPVVATMTNNTFDSDFGHVPQWRAWTVPTQAQLTADSAQPNAFWKPYYGEYVSIQPTDDQVAEAVKLSDSPLTLNDETVVKKYKTSWGDWNLLKDTKLQVVQTVAGDLDLVADETIDSTKLTVYLNGAVQLSTAYEVDGDTVTIPSVAVGSTGTAIIRKYEPTVAELAFDPDTKDNVSIQTQYKIDYEHVEVAVRDADGAISSTLYYFWVKNKTTSAKNKTMSLQTIVQELREGPEAFVSFQGKNDGTLYSVNGSYGYDAVGIAGLSYLVGKDNTYKIRFIKNFTLRDDSEDLNLKDTHTEWTLIRPGQRTKIPEALWMKLTDSVCGEDAAGNAVPALRRVLYDERNGTQTQFGFGSEQILAKQDLLISSILQSIINTKLVNKSVPANADGTYPPDFIEFLDFAESDTWFATPEASRKTMTDIWTTAKISQINDIFFCALEDILANNYEMTDLFKTSRLAAYSIKVVSPGSTVQTYE